MNNQRNDWKRRLRLDVPNQFYWREDPPQGAQIGDRADFQLDGRYYIRSANGRNINIDQIGPLFLGYRAPDDHRPKRGKRRAKSIRSKHGVDVRGQCRVYEISPQTYYNRRHAGMPHELALKATTAQVRAWKRNGPAPSEMGQQELDWMKEWGEQAVWMSQMGLDRYMAPASRESYIASRIAGLAPKQAILMSTQSHGLDVRRKLQTVVLPSAKLLHEALPDIQKALASASAKPGVLIAARLLAMVNMMASAETALKPIPEVVYGNLVLAAIGSIEPPADHHHAPVGESKP